MDAYGKQYLEDVLDNGRPRYTEAQKEEVRDSIRNMMELIHQNKNILIVDDIATSGSTLNELLRTLRILNEDNDITIFSLIGRNDLMADTI